MSDELSTNTQQFAELGIPFGLTASDLDNSNTAEDILTRALTAKTLEDLYAAETTEKFENLVGNVFSIRSFKYMPSDYPESEGWPYVVIDAVDEDGGMHTIVTGARKVVLYLAIAEHNQLLPAPFRFLADQTAAGNDVYSLGRP